MSFKCLPYQLSNVVYVSGLRRDKSLTPEKMTPTAKDGNRSANYPLSVVEGSDKK